MLAATLDHGALLCHIAPVAHGLDESVEFLTPEEVSSLLRVPPRTVMRLANSGKLRGVKIGKQWRFPRESIADLMSGQDANRRRSILVVDDDVEILTTIRRFLLKEGYEVVCCESGKLALEELEHEKKFSLLLLDLLLPDITGPEIIRWMQEHGIDVPVLLVTAYTDSELMDQALQYGVCAVIKKPFMPEDLISAIERLIVADEQVASASL